LSTLRLLPHLNATLNALSFVFLATGFRFIRQRRIAAHRACMLSACATSLLFFASYLTYHFQVGSVKFPGTGWPRTLYLSILGTHTVLAATVPILAILTLRLALKESFPSHRRIARWTFPIWVYVSVTGVIVYVMLYWIYGARASEGALAGG
jgi:putative membrane protein